MENRIPFFWFSIITAFMIIFYGLFVILGMIFNYFSFSNALLAPAKFNSTVCFILLSLSVISLEFEKLWLVRLFSLLPTIFGLFSLLFDITSLDLLGFDHFVNEHLKNQPPSYRHLSPNSSLALILLGSSFFICTFKKEKYAFFTAIIFSTITIAIALVTIFSYLSGLEVYGWESVDKMRFQAAVLFLILGFQNAYYAWNHFEIFNEKWLYPWLALPFFIFVIASTLGLWKAFKAEERFSIAEQNKLAVQDIKSAIKRSLAGQIKSIKKTGRHWAFKGPDADTIWEADAYADIYFEPSILMIATLGPDGLYQKTFTNSGGSTFLAGVEFPDDTFLNKAKILQNSVLFQKQNELFIVEPIFLKDQFKGYVVVTYDLKAFISSVLRSVIDPTDAIRISSGNETIFMTQGVGKEAAKTSFSIDDVNWVITVTSASLRSFSSQSLSAFIFIFGLLLACLVFSAVFLGIRAKIRTSELENVIYELHSTQARLVEQEKLASLGTVTAGIAHEIKNPLTFVNTFSDLSLRLMKELSTEMNNNKSAFKSEKFQEITESMHTLKENLESINKHGLRATNIVQKMGSHAVSRNTEKVRTDLHQLIEEYYNLAYRSFRSQEPDFVLMTDRSYLAKNTLLKIDPEGLGRVLINIFNNSFYAMMKKRKVLGKSYNPELFISTKNIGTFLVVSIRDNGEGMSQSVKDKLFTPFFTTKPPGEGTGLGLSLSHKIIVQEHAGKLEFKSQEGEYSEFILSLPLREP